jgi:hypothetical protein
MSYYIKTAGDDVRSAMATLEKSMPAATGRAQSDTDGTLDFPTPVVTTSVN